MVKERGKQGLWEKVEDPSPPPPPKALWTFGEMAIFSVALVPDSGLSTQWVLSTCEV
jgi:hypothetical protein